ncbi:MAG: U32 family peptidase [Clostridia bacterium]|nr:U32 family peptidase [Clostridia bacterium]
MKMKLLSPAGNFESLKSAVLNGADEVYLGINSFNARNNIDGFTLENLQEAVDFAHVYGVKVFLAINILFKDEELNSALQTVVKANNIGVDAFIVQDLALAFLIKQNYPGIILHASTQMGIHNLDGAKWAENFGFSRVVLSRETSLDEIENIHKNTNLEIEYFVQGALCVCFSGNCYLSSYLNSASGNRGICKQLCRLPYKFYEKEKLIADGFLLSAKDFNMISRLKDLENAGVLSLKIEGRARRPFYVGMATKQYRNALDGLSYDENALKIAFNREYTEGYFNGNGNIISPFNNHIGIKIGKVLSVNKGKNFTEFTFSSSRQIAKKSAIKLFKNGVEFSTISLFDLKSQNGKYSSTTTQKVEPNLDVYLISDAALEEEIALASKKVEAEIEIFAFANSHLKANIKCKDVSFSLEGEICEQAKSRPLLEEDFKKCFEKSSVFAPKLKINTSGVFLPVKSLNDFRRNVYVKLIAALTKNTNKILEFNPVKTNLPFQKLENFKVVEKLNENFDAQNIILSPEIYNLEDVIKFKQKCESYSKTAILDLPNFATNADCEFLKNIIKKTNITVLANNYYALSLTNNFVVGPMLNVFNSVSANILDKPILTAESDIAPKLKAPYMTLRHCPIKTHTKCDCAHCKFNNNYYYTMQNGKKLKLKRKKLSSCTFYLVD